MARIHIELPDQFLFQTEIPVRASDLNYGGHVGNDTLLTIIQEARVSFYRSLGFADETKFDGTIGQVIADAALQYKSESFLGDILLVEIAVREFTRYGFDMVYRVTEKNTKREVARAKTGIVCLDYAIRNIVSIPSILSSKLNNPS